MMGNIGALIFSLSLSTPLVSISERPLSCGQTMSYFGVAVAGLSSSDRVPAQMRAAVKAWCRESRYFYDPAAPQTILYTGSPSRDRIVLGTDNPVDPRQVLDPRSPGDLYTCLWLRQLGESLTHELVHLTANSDHDEANGQDGWTGAWGGCLFGRAMYDYVRSTPRLGLCKRAFARPDQYCQSSALRAPSGFTPPDWWPPVPALLRRERTRPG